MIRLRQTKHTGNLEPSSAFELYSGESEESLELLGYLEISMRGSGMLNGTCAIYDTKRTLVEKRPVMIGDGSPATLRRAGVDVLRQGFPSETDVA